MRMNRQKRLENIRRTLELSKTKSIDEIAEVISVTPNTIRNYLSHAQTHDLVTNKIIETACADCGCSDQPLHKYQNKMVCDLCLNPPIKYDVTQFLGRHTAIHSL